MALNDIWAFLHDPDQRWYLRSDMDHSCAYVFNTLSTPHSACTLPGEGHAERCYRSLEDGERAVAAGDVAALVEAVSPVRRPGTPIDMPQALRGAVGAMAAVADEAHRDPTWTSGDGAQEWLSRSRGARCRVVRVTLEMRMVVSIDGERRTGPRPRRDGDPLALVSLARDGPRG